MSDQPTTTAAHLDVGGPGVAGGSTDDGPTTTAATITRVDRYTVDVNGAHIRATEDQERQLRAMARDALERFLRIMGVKP